MSEQEELDFNAAIDEADFTSWETDEGCIEKQITQEEQIFTNCGNNNYCAGCSNCAPSFEKNKKELENLRLKMITGDCKIEDDNEKAAKEVEKQLQIERDEEFANSLAVEDEQKRKWLDELLNKEKEERSTNWTANELVGKWEAREKDHKPCRITEDFEITKLTRKHGALVEKYYKDREIHSQRDERCHFMYAGVQCACSMFNENINKGLGLSNNCGLCGHVFLDHSPLRLVTKDNEKEKKKID